MHVSYFAPIDKLLNQPRLNIWMFRIRPPFWMHFSLLNQCESEICLLSKGNCQDFLHWDLGSVENEAFLFFLPSNNLFSEQAVKNSSIFFPCDAADGKFPFKRMIRVAAGTELCCLSQIYLQRVYSNTIVYYFTQPEIRWKRQRGSLK